MSTKRVKENIPLIAAIAFAVVVCAALIFRPAGEATQHRENTLPAPKWSAANRPTGFLMEPNDSTWAIAPSDGTRAYSCMPHRLLTTSYGNSDLTPGPTAVWSSKDSGGTWQAAANLPPAAFNPSGCGIVVDAVDPSIVLASVVGPRALPGHNLSPGSQFISTDGGAHWASFSTPGSDGAYQLATLSGVTYARYCGQQDIPGCGVLNAQSYVGLAATHGDFQHWHIISPPNPGLKQNIDNFWLGRTSSDLYAETQSVNPDGPSNLSIWHSTDGGTIWKQASVPSDVAYLVVQPTIPTQTPLICGPSNSIVPKQFAVVCSADGGLVWERVTSSVVQPTPTPSATYLGELDLLGITSTGDLIVDEFVLNGDIIYRMSRPGGAGQRLGVLPGGTTTQAIFVGGAHSGILWAVPLHSSNVHTPFDPAGALFTADYPA